MRKEIAILGVIVIAVIVALIFGSDYYRRSIKKDTVAVKTGGSQATISAEQLVRPDSPTLGPANAKVTLVEFYDPECEACAAFAPIVKRLLKNYEGRLRLVARYMPLHPNSVAAAVFTEAAGEQGKYWQAQELLFQKQSEWGEKHGQPTAAPTSINVLFEKYAMELGLDWNRIDLAMKENRTLAKIERDKKDGQDLGVRQTPSFFVNGRKLMQFSESGLKELIDAELAE